MSVFATVAPLLVLIAVLVFAGMVIHAHLADRRHQRHLERAHEHEMQLEAGKHYGFPDRNPNANQVSMEPRFRPGGDWREP